MSQKCREPSSLRKICFVQEQYLFRTTRLEARRLEIEDVSAMLDIFGDSETMQFVDDAQVLDEDECRRWIVEVTDRNFLQRGYGLIGFFSLANSLLIACGGVFHPNNQPEPEIMYWVRRDEWGKGLASEIVIGLVEYARSHWGIGSMVATIHPENLPSQRVIAKAGFHLSKEIADDDGSTTQLWALIEHQ